MSLLDTFHYVLEYCLQLDCIIVFVFNDAQVDSTSLVSIRCSAFIPDNGAHEKPILPRQRMFKRRKYFVEINLLD
jgi:hypothetical protein